MNYTGSRAWNSLQTPTIQGTMESNFFVASKAADMGNSSSEGFLDLHLDSTGQLLSSHHQPVSTGFTPDADLALQVQKFSLSF